MYTIKFSDGSEIETDDFFTFIRVFDANPFGDDLYKSQIVIANKVTDYWQVRSIIGYGDDVFNANVQPIIDLRAEYQVRKDLIRHHFAYLLARDFDMIDLAIDHLIAFNDAVNGIIADYAGELAQEKGERENASPF